MKNLIIRFVKDESGAHAIEYGLIAAGILVAIMVTVRVVGTELEDVFDVVRTEHHESAQ